MDIQTYWSTYSQPLLVGGVIGLILGWLITWFFSRRRAQEFQAAISSLESRLRKAESDLSASRKQAEQAESNLKTSQTNLRSAEADLTNVRSQITDLQAELESLGAEKATLEADLESVSNEKVVVETQLAESMAQADRLQADYQKFSVDLQTEFDKLKQHSSELQARFTDLQEENGTLKANLEDTAVDLSEAKESLETSNQALATKEIALSEAYLRAVRLQRELSEQQSASAAAVSELDHVRRDLAALTTMNQDLEDKLQSARGDVAGELALLTSTMLRMKEEALVQANARIAALTSELDALKSRA